MIYHNLPLTNHQKTSTARGVPRSTKSAAPWPPGVGTAAKTSMASMESMAPRSHARWSQGSLPGTWNFNGGIYYRVYSYIFLYIYIYMMIKCVYIYMYYYYKMCMYMYMYICLLLCIYVYIIDTILLYLR
jgi:hypothetical protein